MLLSCENGIVDLGVECGWRGVVGADLGSRGAGVEARGNRDLQP